MPGESVKKTTNDPIEIPEVYHAEETNDELDQEISYDEYKTQREAKKKDFSLKFPKFKTRKANEDTDSSYCNPYEWIYQKTNNDDNKWKHISHHIEEENVEKTISTLSSVDTHNFSDDDDDDQDQTDKNDEYLQRCMSPNQQQQLSLSGQS
ncbi:unnamed protein product, partial [Adineta steineri]